MSEKKQKLINKISEIDYPYKSEEVRKCFNYMKSEFIKLLSNK